MNINRYNDGIYNIDEINLKRTNIINCIYFKDVFEVYIYDLITQYYTEQNEDIIKYSNNHLNNDNNLFKRKINY